MTQPPFDSLPQVPDQPAYRYVNGRVMEREEYEVCEWHITGSYEVQHPHRPGCLLPKVTLHNWAGTIEGFGRWSQLLQERKQAKRDNWRGRQESDNEWSSHVQSLIEREA